MLPDHIFIYFYAVENPGGRAGRDLIDSPALVNAAHHCCGHVKTGLLSEQVPCNALGDDYLDQLSKKHLTRDLVLRLERLGYSGKVQQAQEQ
jgi:hypothetical protein